MDAKIGTSVLLETYGIKERIKCKLVGWVREEFVVLKAPLSAGIRSRVTDGSHLAVRYLHQGKLIGFRAEYIDFIARPYPLLFVSYPLLFEVHALRGKRRVDCSFLTTLAAKGGTYQGVILDISDGGCRFSFETEQGMPSLSIGDSVEGYFSTLGSVQTHPFKGKVASVEDYKIKGEVGLSFMSQGTKLPDDLLSSMEEVAATLARLKSNS